MIKINSIVKAIESAAQIQLHNYDIRPVGGGSINDAYCLSTSAHDFFIKLNKPKLAEMFVAEAEGLSEMAALKSIRIPEVICYGEADGYSYLVLEYIPLSRMSSTTSTLLGEQLAEMHRTPQAYFGWHRDNTIGSTAQINDNNHDWISFWQQSRLGAQIELAGSKGYRGKLESKGALLVENLGSFFAGYTPHPSLVHGDLWGGNAASDDKGNPVIFDPASYYGDRETDIAMTELFGGFSNDFYSAYNDYYPLDNGYNVRKKLYNLYHILNHLNLFGGSYLSQSESMIEQLLAELR
jgi:protein-ribulosamine 3-kinase